MVVADLELEPELGLEQAPGCGVAEDVAAAWQQA